MGSVGDGRYDHKAPPRLHEFAEQTKAKIDANYTQSFSGLKIREKELPVLPPNVSRSTFNKAIAELRKGLGQEWVELNDKVSTLRLKLSDLDLALERWLVSRSS